MPHDDKLEVTLHKDDPAEVAERTLRFTASTTSEDRDGDVIVPKRIDTEAFEKNPVFLLFHDDMRAPIGKIVGLEKLEDELVVDVEFDDDDPSDKIFQKYKDGFMNAVSIGFLPLEEPESREEGGFEFQKVELLEVSAVTVQSNREALVHRDKEALKKKVKSQNAEKDHTVEQNQTSQDKQQDDGDKPEVNEPVNKAVPSFQDFDVVETESWDGGQAENKLRSWASSDGSGEKDTIDWQKYRKGFLLYNEEAFESGNEPDFKDFKFPFVEPVDGEPVVPTAGRSAAAAGLQSARAEPEPFQEGDIQKAKSHLGRYYQKTDEVPPWDRDDATDGGEERSPETIKKIEVSIEVEAKGIDEAIDKLHELQNHIDERMTEFENSVEEIERDLKATKQANEYSDSSNEPEESEGSDPEFSVSII